MTRQKITALVAIATPTLAIAVAFTLTGCTSAIQVTSDHVAVGNESVELRTWAGASGHWFVNLHDDENTSVDAARWFIGRHGGTVLELAHDGSRNVSFELGGSEYAADPNRIYTAAGRAATLERLSQNSASANDATAALTNAIIDRIRTADPTWVVALHNNSEDAYSLRSYLPGGPYLGDALAIHHGYDMDPDDFYFVTSEQLYRLLARQNLNVVLQNNAGVTDDGSLSVYCAQAGINYVNVEAQHGHERIQRRMIARLVRALAEVEP